MPVFTLSEEEVTKLLRPTNGNDEFQNLVRRLQNGLCGTELHVSDEDVTTTTRCLILYGLDGDWQNHIPKEMKECAYEIVTMPESKTAH